MSKFDDLVNDIDAKRRNPTKDELTSLIKEALSEINELHEKYIEYFEGQGDSKAILAQIEEKLAVTQLAFEKIFPSGVIDTSIVDELEKKVTAIKEYHAGLLEGDESIEADITDSQERITDFYNTLFGEKDGQGVKKQIVDFHELLTKAGGIEEVVNQKHDEILAKYQDLFLAPKGKTTSKITDLESSIEKIDGYKKDFEEVINPEIKKRQQEIKDVSSDIKTKQAEIGALLSDATANTLAEAYTESKYEYSSQKKKTDSSTRLGKIGQFFYNNIGRHGATILNYVLFITPLVAIVLVFTSPDAAKIIASNFAKNGMTVSPIEILYAKTVVSLPLVWIAWFGQRNIAQRKRLFEEYNHKLRVIQMYIMFTTNQTYKLQDGRAAELEAVLLLTIGYNPAEHLGKGETYVDQLKDVVSKSPKTKSAIKTEFAND